MHVSSVDEIPTDYARAIDEVGRDKVFAYMRSFGWTASSYIEKWMWWTAVNELRNMVKP